MLEFAQFPLPGMPLRVVVSCTYSGPERPATVRATLDVPSDEFTSQIVGSDLDGAYLTVTELATAMETMLAGLLEQVEEFYRTP